MQADRLKVGANAARSTPSNGNFLQRWFRLESTQGYLMVAPAVLWLAVLLAYPFVLAIWLGFTDKKVGTPGTFNGIQNFVILWQSGIFRTAFFNTIYYTAVTTVIKVVLGFGLALLLNQSFFGRRFIRAVLLLPWIVPTVLSTMAFLWMFDSNLSSLNWLLRGLGLAQVPWLTKPQTAMISVMIVNVWRAIPFFAITTLTALQTVPAELYEAAEIDGAGKLRQLWSITVPMVQPILAIVMIVSVIGTFSDVQVVASLTNGGPQNSTQVLATLSYKIGLQSGQLGQGAAVGLHMLPFLILMVIWEVWSLRKAQA
jgi:multiple sugar transport system permease protein